MYVVKIDSTILGSAIAGVRRSVATRVTVGVRSISPPLPHGDAPSFFPLALSLRFHHRTVFFFPFFASRA